MTSLNGWFLAALAALAIAAGVMALRPEGVHHSQSGAFALTNPPAKPAAAQGPSKTRKGRPKPTGEAPGKPTSKAEARAFARAVNLRSSDLPYMQAYPDEGGSKQIRREREFQRCSGVSAGGRVAHVPSPTFGSDSGGAYQRYQSGVEVLSTADLAAERGADYQTSRTLGCLQRFISKVFHQQDSAKGEYGSIHVSRLPTPLPGVESFGYRIATKVIASAESSELSAYHPGSRPVARREVPIYFDILVFIDGPAEVNLDAIGAPRPIPTSVERHLLRLLHLRAVANRP
jgi:hypothetical protein